MSTFLKKFIRLIRAAVGVLALCAIVASSSVIAQQQAPSAATRAGAALATVRLTKAVMADGKSLAAGSYQVRAVGEEPTPAVGQSPHAEQWVEFVSGGSVRGREVASVVTSERMRTMAKGPQPTPRAGAYRIDSLRGGEYTRVWINNGGTHYLINLRNPGK